MRVDGTVEGGSIETLGNVLITAGARVMADIKAKTVSVAGGYKGTITADRVELLEAGGCGAPSTCGRSCWTRARTLTANW